MTDNNPKIDLMNVSFMENVKLFTQFTSYLFTLRFYSDWSVDVQGNINQERILTRYNRSLTLMR